MTVELEKRLDAVCDSMASAQDDYEHATKFLAEALTGLHERLERLEKWIHNAGMQEENP